MKELLKQAASYNLWASKRLFELIQALPEAQQKAEVPSSFKSLFHTILHMLDAESIWWQRVKLQEKIIRPSEDFSGTTADAIAALLNQSRLWEEWVTNASELSIDHVFHYYNNKKELIKLPVYQVLFHVCNHGTYHRGQLVNMLRQLGVENIKSTDFVAWSLSGGR